MSRIRVLVGASAALAMISIPLVAQQANRREAWSLVGHRHKRVA